MIVIEVFIVLAANGTMDVITTFGYYGAAVDSDIFHIAVFTCTDGVGSILALCRGNLCDGVADRDVTTSSYGSASDTGAVYAGGCDRTAVDDDIACGYFKSAADAAARVRPGGVQPRQ